MKNLTIYDNQGETYDRFTVFDDDMPAPTKSAPSEEALTLSPDLKVSMFAFATRGDHLGEQIQFDTLPANVQQHIKERLNQ